MIVIVIIIIIMTIVIAIVIVKYHWHVSARAGAYTPRARACDGSGIRKGTKRVGTNVSREIGRTPVFTH